jgi:glycosyltransferase involved in cell wall biosynthesis
MRQAVKSLQDAAHFDIMQIEFPSLASYLDYKGNSVTFLTEHDVTFVSCYRRFQLERAWPLKLRRFMAFATFLLYELQHLPRFDTVIAVTEHDRDVLLRWLPRLSVVPILSGVDCEYFAPPDHPPAIETLLFVGNFNHPPNIDAILFFVQEVWPELSNRFPNLRLLIVGAAPPLTIQAFANDRVIVTGRVPDVRPYYAQASAVVVPVRFGSGVRIKMLEAFAAGVPVISTTMGAEGIEAEPNVHYLLADSPEAFITQISRLIQDKSVGELLRRNARHLVESQYDWQVLAQQQLELYERRRRQRQS